LPYPGCAQITSFAQGSCWIPGSWMCRWRPTRLLCEFARKKENPPVKWYLQPLLGTVSYVLIPASDALPTIGRCSAELPVIRGRGHSHASRCLCVRDQETSLRFILLAVLAGCRHQESNEVAVATLFMPARVGPDPWRVPLPPFLSLVLGRTPGRQEPRIVLLRGMPSAVPRPSPGA
jgi:hypothetical protein